MKRSAFHQQGTSTLFSGALGIIVLVVVFLKLGADPIASISARSVLFQAQEEALSCLTLSDGPCSPPWTGRSLPVTLESYEGVQEKTLYKALMVQPSLSMKRPFLPSFVYKYSAPVLSSVTVEGHEEAKALTLSGNTLQAPLGYVVARRVHPFAQIDFQNITDPSYRQRLINNMPWQRVHLDDFVSTVHLSGDDAVISERTNEGLLRSYILGDSLDTLSTRVTRIRRSTDTPKDAFILRAGGAGSLTIPLGKVPGLPKGSLCFTATPERTSFDSEVTIIKKAQSNTRRLCSRDGLTEDLVPIALQIRGKGMGTGAVTLSLKGEGIKVFNSNGATSSSSPTNLGGLYWENPIDDERDASFVPRGIGIEALRRLSAEAQGRVYHYEGEEEAPGGKERSLTREEIESAKLIREVIASTKGGEGNHELNKYAVILVPPDTELSLTITKDTPWSKTTQWRLQEVWVTTPGATAASLTETYSTCIKPAGAMNAAGLVGSAPLITRGDAANGCISRFLYRAPKAKKEQVLFKTEQEITVGRTDELTAVPFAGTFSALPVPSFESFNRSPASLDCTTKKLSKEDEERKKNTLKEAGLPETTIAFDQEQKVEEEFCPGGEKELSCKENNGTLAQDPKELLSTCGVSHGETVLRANWSTKELGSCRVYIPSCTPEGEKVFLDPGCKKTGYPLLHEELIDEGDPLFEVPIPDNCPMKKSEETSALTLYTKLLAEYNERKLFPSPYSNVQWELFTELFYNGEGVEEAGKKVQELLSQAGYEDFSFTVSPRGKKPFENPLECPGCYLEEEKVSDTTSRVLCTKEEKALCCPEGEESCVLKKTRTLINKENKAQEAQKYRMAKAKEVALRFLQVKYPRAHYGEASSPYALSLEIAPEGEGYRVFSPRFTIPWHFTDTPHEIVLPERFRKLEIR